MRDAIVDFEVVVREFPGALIGDNDTCPLTHKFCDGFYVREIFIPKGMIIVGKIHKHSHPNFLLSGEVTVVTEEGIKRFKAPQSLISPAGTKRVLYTHEDTVWVTCHTNQGNTQDLEKLEEQIIAKDYVELDNFQKQLT